MALLDFPSNPSLGQVYNGAGVSWQWDGAKWMNTSTTSGQLVPEAPQDGFMYERVNANWTRDPIQTDAPAGIYSYGRVAGAWVPTVGGASVGTTPPASPLTGQLWYDLNSGETYCYVDDGNSKQWVITNNISAAYLATNSDTPPSNPANGQLWFDTVGGQAYIWFNDGSSAQWVVANNMAGAYLPLSGGTLSGPIILAPNQTPLPIKGVTDGSNALAGNVGEYVSASGSYTITVSATYYPLCSIVLQPGDWDIWGFAQHYVQSGMTGFNFALAGIGLANNTINFSSPCGGSTTGNFYIGVPPTRANLAAATTFYMIGYAGFTAAGSGDIVNGQLYARRKR